MQSYLFHILYLLLWINVYITHSNRFFNLLTYYKLTTDLVYPVSAKINVCGLSQPPVLLLINNQQSLLFAQAHVNTWNYNTPHCKSMHSHISNLIFTGCQSMGSNGAGPPDWFGATASVPQGVTANQRVLTWNDSNMRGGQNKFFPPIFTKPMQYWLKKLQYAVSGKGKDY